MKKVLILEDKEINRNTLIKILEEVESSLMVYCASGRDEAYRIAMENDISLFLVDIILDTEVRGDVSGLRFANAIRKIEKYSFTPLIFITSLEDPKMLAYQQLHCYGYIEKPFDENMVKKLVKEALNFPVRESTSEQVFFRNDGIVYSVSEEELIYVEVNRKEISVHTTRENMKIAYRPVHQIMDRLNPNKFVQCNRNSIINKRHIEYVDSVNRYVKLRGVEELVEIGRAMKARVLNEFRD